jgi:uncharacterized protein
MTQAYIAWVVTAVYAAMIVGFLWNDLADYRRFKTLTDSAARCHTFRKWIVKAAALFGGGAVVGLAILRRLPALAGRPVEFGALAALMPQFSGEDAGALALGAGIGLVIGVAAIFLVLRLRRNKPVPLKTLGDIEPLLPRNGRERIWALLISLNAGWCEELFFRLALPLVLTLAVGNAYVGFGIAIAVFGAVHFYQGFAGIVATTILGVLFAAIYLSTGNIWIAAAVHALVDINGLIVQPALRRGAR